VRLGIAEASAPQEESFEGISQVMDESSYRVVRLVPIPTESSQMVPPVGWGRQGGPLPRCVCVYVWYGSAHVRCRCVTRVQRQCSRVHCFRFCLCCHSTRRSGKVQFLPGMPLSLVFQARSAPNSAILHWKFPTLLSSPIPPPWPRPRPANSVKTWFEPSPPIPGVALKLL
jgi:hypothetical protein